VSVKVAYWRKANQIHKWSHQNHSEKHAIVKWLQTMHILQGPRQHGKHHSGEKNTHYCVMTNMLNPFLEKIRFWRGLENLLSFTFA
ncbi:MAG: fatty acid desaturase CarF family protein, partial [Pseudomonadota bacterium]